MTKTEIWGCGFPLFQLRHSWGLLPSVVENKGIEIIAQRVNTMMAEYIYIKSFSKELLCETLIVHFNTFTSWNLKGSAISVLSERVFNCTNGLYHIKSNTVFWKAMYLLCYPHGTISAYWLPKITFEMKNIVCIKELFESKRKSFATCQSSPYPEDYIVGSFIQFTCRTSKWLQWVI